MTTVWDEKFGGADHLHGTRANAFLMARAVLLKPGMRTQHQLYFNKLNERCRCTLL